jgi:ubiquinone/menaquinone biosynthesis C-methylase UbiE
MAEAESFFSNGEAYERSTGQWSRAAGGIFLDWLSLPNSLDWLDVGCGTGVLTELVLQRCLPRAISAIDTSADQIEFAKSRPSAGKADYRVADAKDLPFDDNSFDVAAMALVITFVGDQPKSVKEMRRVVRPGGTIATYIWDIPGGGHFQQPIREAIKSMGVEVLPNKTDDFTRGEVLADLFRSVGLENVSGHTIEFQMEFPNFEDYWGSQTGISNNTVRPILELSEADVERLQALLRASLPTDSDGHISYPARCNAVRGFVPK